MTEETRISIDCFVRELIATGTAITVMESCTSGLIASAITDTPGASAIFPGGFVAYSNQAKILCGVDADIINTYGVYSEECARSMAEAAQKAFGTDISIGVTGTTGNIDPANSDSTPGEVYFCILFGKKPYNFHITLETEGKSRHEIKEEIVEKVLLEALR